MDKQNQTITNLELLKYLDPIEENRTVIEIVIRQIISLIKKASLKPGDKLPAEKEIIEATKASRPSVREALRALRTMGVIETHPGSGSFVKEIELSNLIRPDVVSLTLMSEDLLEILHVRRILECEVARLAARAGPDALARLEDSLNDMRSCLSSGMDLYKSTWTFHMGLAEIAGNRVLAKLVRILYGMTNNISLKLYWPNIDLLEEVENHERLYQAACKGEGPAVDEMERHLKRVAEIVKHSIDRDTQDKKVSGLR